MEEQIKTKINPKFFLYAFDFIGPVPQFRILKYDSYKNIFSSILSIIIIATSIGFTIYSIIDYLQFGNPSISYLKKYDDDSISLKDNLFMFKAYAECNNPIVENIGFKYNVTYIFGDGNETHLNIEPCNIGENINIEFKEDLEKKYKNRINEFYCISSQHGDLSLYYRPSASSDRLSYIKIDVFNEICDDINYYYIELITENDIIDHNNKNKPIIPSSYYYKSHRFWSFYFLNIEYNFEFIKYENDNGYFFQNSEVFVAVGASEITHENQMLETETHVAKIKYAQSEKNSSHYKRSYMKIQSLLANIMTIINILIVIGKIIAFILLQKKMNKDIVRMLINRSIFKINDQHALIEKNKKEKKIFNNKNENTITSNKKAINKTVTEKSNIKDITNRLFNIKPSRMDIFFEERLEKNKKKGEDKLSNTINIWKKINIFEIIKSYFCKKGKIKQIIDKCDNIINKDLCIERMLGRLYDLEKLNDILSKKKLSRINSHINKEFIDVYGLLKKISKEEKKKNKISSSIEIKNKDKDKNNIILGK